MIRALAAKTLELRPHLADQCCDRLSCYGFLFLTIFLATACSDQTSTGAIIQKGELRLITRNGPTTYYLGKEGPRGFDYELAAGFARELGVELVVEQAFSLDALFSALERGEADIAGASLTLTDRRAQNFAPSSAFAQQTPQVVYKVGEGRPRTLGDLEGLRIGVLAGSSHEAQLADIRAGGVDWLEWNSLATGDPLELLAQVSAKELDVAVVDSREFFIQQNLVPSLAVAFDLGKPQDIVWYLPSNFKESELLTDINEFLAQQQQNGTLERLGQVYFEQDDRISRVDSQTFVNAVRRELPKYQQLIQIIAEENQIDWEMLAAISYQESHWNPQATSPTGVRGMMMLTRATASDLGVTKRTDVNQSLRGGAKYFLALRRRLPSDIEEPDRTWFALAAYNIGMGHLEDARILTERQGGDPHQWSDVLEVLPALEDRNVYPSLRYGYARGLEAAGYVQNIRHYYKILRWQTARARRPLPPADARDYLPERLEDITLLAL
ncbi:MAG: membrane-bound lytic murein transglycosylase MltF [Pseudomonadota bacterium]